MSATDDDVLLHVFPAEVMWQILELLPARDFAALRQLNSEWRDVIDAADQYWRGRVRASFPLLPLGWGGEASLLQRRGRNDWEALELELARACRRPTAEDSQRGQLLAEGVGQSSCDDEFQGIENTLLPFRSGIWSSAAHPDKNKPEWLIYRLDSPVALVTELAIAPMENRKAYAPTHVTLSVGWSPEPDAAWTPVVHNAPVANRGQQQWFTVPPACLAAGAFVRLDFPAKYETHFVAPHANDYYICLFSVRAYGVRLADLSPPLGCRLVRGLLSASAGHFLHFLQRLAASADAHRFAAVDDHAAVKQLVDAYVADPAVDDSDKEAAFLLPLRNLLSPTLPAATPSDTALPPPILLNNDTLSQICAYQ